MLTALSIAIPGGVCAASVAEQMGRAMARMMEGFSDQASKRGNLSLDQQTGPQSWGGMSPGMSGVPWSGMNPWGGAPWNQLSMIPGQIPGVAGMPNWGSQNWGVPGGSAPGGANTQQLNGAWISNQGIGMIIRGRQLRLFSDTEQHRDMTMSFEGNHVWLFDRDSGTAKRYEFAHADDRMALRDAAGNTLLFRRWQGPKRSLNR